MYDRIRPSRRHLVVSLAKEKNSTDSPTIEKIPLDYVDVSTVITAHALVAAKALLGLYVVKKLVDTTAEVIVIRASK